MEQEKDNLHIPAKSRRRRANISGEMPKLEDIARAAGVSTATASRALNNPDSVSEALRKKVSAKVSELGYVPSGAARALASNRSFTVGAVIPTLNNAIFAESISAFEAALSANGYTLLVTVSNYNQENESEQIRRLLERGVDALMIVGLDHLEGSWVLMERTRCPVVAIWGHAANTRIPCMGFDNADAAARAIDHLIARGHTRIAMIAGISQGNDRAAARRLGVEGALRRHGLPVDPALFIEQAYSHANGRKAFADLMQQNDPPTAIMCGNDVLAMGAIFEAQARGIMIPDEVSIIGFDNLPITEHLQPALTTLDVPSRQMGEAAAEAIVDYLRDGTPIVSRTFHAPLLERGTTSAPARQAHHKT